MVWSYVNPLNILDICDVPNPVFCLLNDNSDINLKKIQLKVLFAAFTFTKKYILKFAPEMCMRAFWIHSPVNIVNLEHTTACLNKAWAVTVQSWKSFSSWIIFWSWANND